MDVCNDLNRTYTVHTVHSTEPAIQPASQRVGKYTTKVKHNSDVNVRSLFFGHHTLFFLLFGRFLVFPFISQRYASLSKPTGVSSLHCKQYIVE